MRAHPRRILRQTILWRRRESCVWSDFRVLPVPCFVARIQSGRGEKRGGTPPLLTSRRLSSDLNKPTLLGPRTPLCSGLETHFLGPGANYWSRQLIRGHSIISFWLLKRTIGKDFFIRTIIVSMTRFEFHYFVYA